MHFEDVLSSVDDYGRYQKKLIAIFLIPISILNPVILLHLIFSLSIPDHWCHDPSLEELNLTLPQKLLLLRPNEGRSNEPSKCSTYDHNYTTLFQQIELYNGNISAFVTENAYNWSKKECIYGWEYDQSEFKETAPSKWDLVCSNDYLPSLVFTLVRVGSTVGTPILSTITERIGRKPMFFVMCTIGLVTGVGSALIPWFVGFALLRTLFGTISPLLFQSSFILLTELVSPDMRTRINGLVCVFWTLGMAALPLFAYLCADWSMYTIVCSAFFLICFVYIRSVDLIAYEGFHMSISQLYGNQFINFLLMALVEIPSYCLSWILIETRLGRRLTNVLFLLLSAIACYLPVIFSDFSMVTTISSLMGKFGCAASFMIIYQQAAELFPTPVRTSGMGIGGTICCFLSISTPYIVYTGVYNKHVPFSVFGSISLIAAIAAMFLPETLNATLPQTMEDAQGFGLDQKFFGFANTKTSSKQVVEIQEEMNTINNPE